MRKCELNVPACALLSPALIVHSMIYVHTKPIVVLPHIHWCTILHIECLSKWAVVIKLHF
uniref:Uncharacterized protein n=1 Tax=Rhizophora mucronata TaxID=61149 RepID=A0A2P2J160_RHIMU